MALEFSEQDLQEIVELTGRLLEKEDRFICECLRGNEVYRNDRNVIDDFVDERYLQRIALKALLPSFRFGVRLEREERADIALFKSFQEDPVAVGEMKRAMRGSANADIREIREGIERLAARRCRQFLLIFTRNPKLAAEENIRHLLGETGCSEKTRYDYAFDTVYPDHPNHVEQNGQFAVIGVLLQ